MRFDLLRQIAEDVRSVPTEEMFDMDHYDCGTAACAIGWHKRRHPECPLHVSTNTVFLGIDYGANALAEYLGIGIGAVFRLFIPYMNDSKNYPKYFTREAVAARIEAFVKEHEGKA